MQRGLADGPAMTMAVQNREIDLRELLAFYAEAGVDDALTEEPANRLAMQQQPVSQLPAEVAPSRTTRMSWLSPALPAEPGFSAAVWLIVKV